MRVRGQGRSEGTLQRAGHRSQVTETPVGRVGRKGGVRDGEERPGRQRGSGGLRGTGRGGEIKATLGSKAPRSRWMKGVGFEGGRPWDLAKANPAVGLGVKPGGSRFHREPPGGEEGGKLR